MTDLEAVCGLCVNFKNEQTKGILGNDGRPLRLGCCKILANKEIPDTGSKKRFFSCEPESMRWSDATFCEHFGR